MKFSYSNAQMRAFDNQTIANGTPSLTLMERAGNALARAVLNAMHRLNVGDALFLCGGGNNGGDGFVAARILAEMGEDVQVVCVAEKFSPDCLAVKAGYHGEILGILPRRRYALVVDCLFGTGLTRPITGKEADLVCFCNESGAYVISCDIPSGLRENGVATSPCVRADETVCMGQLKNALFLLDGVDYAGKIIACDIGISPTEQGVELWEEGDVRQFFPKKKSNVNKGTFGCACILSPKLSGATVLSATACLASGVGYTKYFLPQEGVAQAVFALPSCVVRPFEGINEEILSANAIAVGMGAGVSEEVYALVKRLLQEYTGTLLIDADGLNCLSRYGVEVLNDKKCQVILTPHPKEFSRLTGKSVEEILREPLLCAQSFVKKYGVTLVLKNNRTLVANGERVAINTTGSSVLAKGGSGDVLSGLLAGTIARGVAPFESACIASYLLGKVSELTQSELGEYAPTPQTVASYLSRVVFSVEE